VSLCVTGAGRRLMSAQASHTAAGSQPRRTRAANTRHPMQKAKAASRVAAATTAARRPAVTTLEPATSQAAAARVVRVAPMAWANRLGGPGTGRSGRPRRGTTARVTSRAHGLNRGPLRARATNP